MITVYRTKACDDRISPDIEPIEAESIGELLVHVAWDSPLCPSSHAGYLRTHQQAHSFYRWGNKRQYHATWEDAQGYLIGRIESARKRLNKLERELRDVLNAVVAKKQA